MHHSAVIPAQILLQLLTAHPRMLVSVWSRSRSMSSQRHFGVEVVAHGNSRRSPAGGVHSSETTPAYKIVPVVIKCPSPLKAW